jgi:heptosyltransferase-2
MRAVLIDPAFLGDVVFDGPFARAFKRMHPQGELAMVVRPPAEAVAERLAGVDRVHVFDKRGRDRGLAGLLRMARELAVHRYDVAYVPHPSVRSTMLARQARIPVRIGSARGFLAKRFLTAHRPPLASDTFVRARLRLLDSDADEALAGCLERPARSRSDRARIGLVLGSNWATKRWDPSCAAEMAARLDPDRHRLVLLGSESERPLYSRLRFVELEDALGGTVSELIDRIAGCDLLIAGDTGPLHIARALGVPVVALFGPTSEKQHAFTELDRALAIDIECRPCSAHGDRVCPRVHHRCMTELSGGRAAQVVLELARAIGSKERELG